MRRLVYFFGFALTSMRKSVLPNLMSVGIIAFSLCILGGFGMLLANLDALWAQWGRSLRVDVYLADGVNDAGRAKIEAELKANPRVAAVEYVSPATALQRFKQAFPGADALTAGLDDDLLPAAFSVSLQPESTTLDHVAVLADELSRLKGVAEVEYGREELAQLKALVQALRLVALVLGAALVLATVVIVSNTIQLTVMARHDEIEIFKLVGATDMFVRAPFVIEGVLQGLLGAGAAVAVLGLGFGAFHEAIQAALAQALGDVELVFLSNDLVLGVMLGGAALGLLGSVLAVGRFLRA